MRIYSKPLSAAVALLFAATAAVSAQSMAEISAAKSMAKAYGYSDKEIENVLNHNIAGTAATTQAATTGATVVTPVAKTEAAGTEDTAPVTVLTPAPAAQTAPAGPGTTPSIYGHDYFKSSGLSVVPSYNAPAPASYVLGPGDELVIDIWGASTSHIVAEIGNDGAISVFDMGPVYLSGMTLKAAEDMLKAQLTRLYSGLDNGNGGDTYLKLSIGKIKGVVVSILGEVGTPGAYTIPSLSSITSAIFLAGGVTDNGTVRNINLFRGGKKVSTFDLYAFIFDGKFDPDVRLQDGDVISVEPYGAIVSVSGEVVRGEKVAPKMPEPELDLLGVKADLNAPEPLRTQRYEVKEGETIHDVIRYAGGFTTAAQKDQVHLTRRNAANGQAFDIKEASYKSFKLQDGDALEVRTMPELYDNRVTITGPVANPGGYAISDGISDVASLIRAAGGLLEGAYMGRGQINRLDENRLPVFITFDLEKVLSGKENVALVREDKVTLFSQDELRERFTATVEGYVNNPGTFEFTEGMTVADALLLAKGVKDDAARGMISRTDHQGVPQIVTFDVSNVLRGQENIQLFRSDSIRVYSVRELREDATVEITGEVNAPAEVTYREGMTLSDLVMIGGGFTNGVDMRNVEIASRGGRERGTVEIYDIESNPGLMSMALKPYDVVSFRKLTYFRPQTTVTVAGEVMSPGTYVVDKAEVRLSDVVGKVGGFTDEAYIHGAKLTRTLTKEETEMLKTAALIANQNLEKGDSLNLAGLSTRFNIAIELDKALEKPGSQYDVILRPGDTIEVPARNNTVRVNGAVFYPNVLTYEKGETWKQYVQKAGGFTKKARRSKSYVIYMNGNVAVAKMGLKIEPGSEIIVPEKGDDGANKLSIGELAALTSSTTSLATLVTALIGIFK